MYEVPAVKKYSSAGDYNRLPKTPYMAGSTILQNMVTRIFNMVKKLKTFLLTESQSD